jgi:sugar phosphate isomerase/epimerase
MAEDGKPGAVSRRTFVQSAGIGALTATTVWPAIAQAAARAPRTPPAKALPIGIELYAVRTELRKDLPNTLRTVKRIGYDVVEFYAPYLAWTMPYAKEVRSMMDDMGLRCHSTHNSFAALTPGDTMTKAIELNQILGSRSIILASPPMATGTVDDWKRLGAQLTAATETFMPHGLAAGFHNHEVEWAALPNGQRVMDVIASETPDAFTLQLDVGTCMKAGADPVAWVRAHPARVRSVHLKDWATGVAPEQGFRVLFGEGSTPWPALLSALESVGGVEYYLMEQEGSRYGEFETAEKCLANWRSMRRKV